MTLIRSTALRASSIARAVRPSRSIRTAELQPWQRTLQRRAYASSHQGPSPKKSDLPWALSAVAGTAVGIYFVASQDLSHGGGHGDEHHAEHAEKHEETHEEEAPAEEEQPKEESKEEPEEEAKAEDKAEDQAEDKPEPGQKEEKTEQAQDEAQEKPKEDSKPEGNNKSASPDVSDAPSPRKASKSSNEMSGKQEGLSNADTKHSTSISSDPNQSKKGEGVAETAKLKGTVSTQRPGAENKEQRGKTRMDLEE